MSNTDGYNKPPTEYAKAQLPPHNNEPYKGTYLQPSEIDSNQNYQDDENGGEIASTIIRRSTSLKIDLQGKALLGFIRKVYGILFVMVLVTIIPCLVPLFSKEAADFLVEYYYILFIGMGLFLFPAILLMINRPLARKVPVNYILLFTATIGQTMML